MPPANPQSDTRHRELDSRATLEGISYKPWPVQSPPKRLLAIRLQAMGDVVITLPYLQNLRDRLAAPTRFDFLTRQEVDSIPRNLDLFDNVFSIGGGRSFKKQILMAVPLLPRLLALRYDVVIDLQQNPLSQWIRKLLHPPCWSEFDRFSPISAGERNRLAIEALGLGPVGISRRLTLRKSSLGRDILANAGLKPGCDLIVLNPAGGWPTKNWPLENYVDFAKLWLAEQSGFGSFRRFRTHAHGMGVRNPHDSPIWCQPKRLVRTTRRLLLMSGF